MSELEEYNTDFIKNVNYNNLSKTVNPSFVGSIHEKRHGDIRLTDIDGASFNCVQYVDALSGYYIEYIREENDDHSLCNEAYVLYRNENLIIEKYNNGKLISYFSAPEYRKFMSKKLEKYGKIGIDKNKVSIVESTKEDLAKLKE